MLKDLLQDKGLRFLIDLDKYEFIPEEAPKELAEYLEMTEMAVSKMVHKA
ncbi:hypothetical protein QBE52_12200 [Clostridiaceae bacterium 35-E11]